MCSRHRAARRAARRGCGTQGWNNGAYQHREGLIRKIVNHIVEHREQKLALARGMFVQPHGALEGGKPEMDVDSAVARDLARSEWVDEKQRLGRDGVGLGVDRVERESGQLPSYGEALKN
jgi:hypothetical protein